MNECQNRQDERGAMIAIEFKLDSENRYSRKE